MATLRAIQETYGNPGKGGLMRGSGTWTFGRLDDTIYKAHPSVGRCRYLTPARLIAPLGTSQEIEFMDLVRILLAVLLPPLGVFLQVGLGLHFWLNIVLTLLGYIPGLVHAIWIIARVGPRAG